MMQSSLLERQTALLKYLTDPVAYGRNRGEGLQGGDLTIDRSRLALIGEGGLRKRAEKIRTKLPITCGLLGSKFPPLMREFAHAFRPSSIRGIDHAEQFHKFLRDRASSEGGYPAYLLDLCGLEIAMIEVGRPEEELAYFGAVFGLSARPGRRYRLAAGAETVRCRYDIRPLFDRTVEAEVCPKDLRLAVFFANGKLRVVEVTSDVFDLLNAIRTLDGNRAAVVPGNFGESLDVLEQLAVVEAL